jgi:hypothetical protein
MAQNPDIFFLENLFPYNLLNIFKKSLSTLFFCVQDSGKSLHDEKDGQVLVDLNRYLLRKKCYNLFHLNRFTSEQVQILSHRRLQ